MDWNDEYPIHTRGPLCKITQDPGPARTMWHSPKSQSPTWGASAAWNSRVLPHGRRGGTPSMHLLVKTLLVLWEARSRQSPAATTTASSATTATEGRTQKPSCYPGRTQKPLQSQVLPTHACLAACMLPAADGSLWHEGITTTGFHVYIDTIYSES